MANENPLNTQQNQPQPAQPAVQAAQSQPLASAQQPSAQTVPAGGLSAANASMNIRPVAGAGRDPSVPNMAVPAPKPVTSQSLPGMVAKKPPSPRRLISWILGCFGCSIVLLVIFVLLFVSQTSSTGDNALAKSLGLDTASFINSLITLVNVIFGFFSIILFIVAIVGIFQAAMARKDDRERRKGALTLAGASSGLLVLMIFIWVGVYLFLSSKKVIAPKTKTQISAILTTPESTIGLTAPVTIKFDGTKLPINGKKYDILSFLWTFGDSETSTVQSPSHTYKNMGKNNGRFDVKVTVALKDNGSGEETSESYSTIVTISNISIDAEFTAIPDNGPAPLTVKFNASASSAPAGQIQSYEWDFNNNNVFTDASGVTAEHTFDKTGDYTVNLRVTDNTGQFATASRNISVTGSNLPAAAIDIPTQDGHYYSGIQYTFSGEKSSSPTGGKITKYTWDFGDQTPKATTRTAVHTYKNAGDYEVILTVADDKGVQGQETQKLTIETSAGALIATFTTIPAPKKDENFIRGPVPFEVNFDASSSVQAFGSIVDYKWDFDGDGNIDSAGKQATYVYKEPGTYNAALTVVDAQNKSANATFVVKAMPQGLKALLTADPFEGVVPLTVTFDASGSSYPNGQIVSYEWDFGDGGPKRIDVSKVTYKYTQIGVFNAKVTAIASDNSRSAVTVPINVRSIPLKACFEPSVETGPAPLTVEFDPRCSTGTVAKYSWNFGDSETSRARKPTHNFAAPGSYQVKLEVSDNQNVIDTFTKSILATGATK